MQIVNSVRCTGGEVLSMYLQSFLHGLIKDILESSIESKGFGTSGMTYILILRKLSSKFQASRSTWRGDSYLGLPSILGVLEDILESWMQSQWLWTSGITYINIEKAVYKLSGLDMFWNGTFFYASPQQPPRRLNKMLLLNLNLKKNRFLRRVL